jgi:hypothetical protein
MTDPAAVTERVNEAGLAAEDLYWWLRECPEEDAIEYLRMMLKLVAWGQYFSKSVAQMYDRLATTPTCREVSP